MKDIIIKNKRTVLYTTLILLVLVNLYTFSDYYIDRSDTYENSLNKGAPSVDKNWKLDEYMAFRDYISNVPIETDCAMISSGKSGKLFKKLISLNRTPLTKKPDELSELLKINAIFSEVVQIYIKKDRYHKYDEEIQHLYGAQLQLIISAQITVADIVKETVEDDPYFNDMIKAFFFIQKATIIQIKEFTRKLEKSTYLYGNEVLFQYYKKNVSKLVDSLDKENKIQFRSILEQAIPNIQIESMKNELIVIKNKF